MELNNFIHFTGFYHLTMGHIVLILIGFILLFLGTSKRVGSRILVPIGFGMIVGNIPSSAGMAVGVFDKSSVLSYLYAGVIVGVYPALFYLGLGAATDLEGIIKNWRAWAIAFVSQLSIIITFILLFSCPYIVGKDATIIATLAQASGPMTSFVSGVLNPKLLPIVGILSFTLMGLSGFLVGPLKNLLITKEEQQLAFPQVNKVSQSAKIIFPVFALIVTGIFIPESLVFLGMFFFGNLLKVSGVTERLSNTAKDALIDIVTMLFAFTIGISANADKIFNLNFLTVLVVGVGAFILSNILGILTAKAMNMCCCHEKVNPAIGIVGGFYSSKNNRSTYLETKITSFIVSVVIAAILLKVFVS